MDTTTSTFRDVAVVASAQTPCYPSFDGPEATLIMRCINEVLDTTGLERSDLQFTIAGSCDYLSGAPFAFVSNIDGVGAWPPVYESHVEMDGAWALFEAWIRLQLGDIDVAVVIGSGKSSPGHHDEVFALQTDPYVMAPLGLDPTSLAGLQARALIDAGVADERAFAEVVARARRAADPAERRGADGSAERRGADGSAERRGAEGSATTDVDALLAQPYVAAPLRAHDRPAIGDGAAVVVLAAGDRAREISDAPVWIRGIDHRIESHHPGLRDLTSSPSTALAAATIGATDAPLDVVELMASYSPQELVLQRALGLGDDVVVNPSGGPLVADPVMATGLIRIAEVARRIAAGDAHRGLAHASSGPCLQQNLLCLMEGGD